MTTDNTQTEVERPTVFDIAADAICNKLADELIEIDRKHGVSHDYSVLRVPTVEARKAMHKIYIFNNGGSREWYSAVAIADDGHCLAQHICSHEGFMAHDTGITSNWKHENYNEHFGEGNWELEWVPDPRNHPGLEAAYALNQQLGKERTEAKGNQ